MRTRLALFEREQQSSAVVCNQNKASDPRFLTANGLNEAIRADRLSMGRRVGRDRYSPRHQQFGGLNCKPCSLVAVMFTLWATKIA